MNIYEVSKYVKSGKPESTEENLLTSILCWAMERDTNILREILGLCRGVDETKNGDRFTLEFSKIIAEEDLAIDFQMTLLSGTEYGIPDFGIDDGKLFLIGEAKVVSEAIDLEQVLDYYKLGREKFHDHDVYVLLITPDLDDYAFQMLKQVPMDRRSHFFWISWQEIWSICVKELEEGAARKIVRNEVKEGIEMAGAKPFEGFDDEVIDAIENMGKLTMLTEFFNAIERILTKSGGLELERHGVIRYQTEGRTAFRRLWNSFWDKKWKKRSIYTTYLSVDVGFLPEPTVGGCLWFPQGESLTSFREIENQCTDIVRDLKKEFENGDVEAGLHFGSESGFYVEASFDNRITRDWQLLQDFIIRILRFFLTRTVPAIEKLGYEF
ncbi:MAG: hypothetical protein ACXAEN_15545 [Candidatus Thorarchaeota archaeon]